MTPGFVFEQAKTTTGVTSSLIADVDVRLDHFDESGSTLFVMMVGCGFTFV